jgi:Ca2+-binding EF-hand superfamily protein
MKNFFLAGVAACLGVSFVGCAQTSKQAQRTSNLTAQFQRADTNQDGKVSTEEFRYLMIEDMFALFDHNEDGYVTREEFIKAGGSPQTFARIDRNNAGRVTLEQAKTARIKLDTVSTAFLAADTDKDGFVTLEEALEYREKARAYTR